MWKRFTNWLSNIFKSDAKIESDAVGEMRAPNLETNSPYQNLIEVYKKTNIEFNNLKNITLAQWMLESARGTSDLAVRHLNFAGLKWRSEMEPFATPIEYKAWDGVDEYCKFETIEDFIKGYWAFLERTPYEGWKTHADTPDEFLKFIYNSGYTVSDVYVQDVLNLLEEATEEMEGAVITPSEPRQPVVTEEDRIVYPSGEKLLYYPKAVRLEGASLRTRGRYPDRYPNGSVQHCTAGRSRTKEFGGKRNTSTIRGRGESGIRSADKRNAYCYFLIDRGGTVYQSFPLNRYGYHAGKSAWKGVGSNVSNRLVGIEMQNAGKLKDYWKNSSGKKQKCPEGKLAAWFTRPDKGDAYFDKATECRYSDGDDNIQKGWYHKLSAEQERALLELNLWLKRNNPNVFDLNKCVAHDEVAGKKGIGYSRKNDTGASLSTTMTTFRNKLNNEYRTRY